ncbi:hypothetical protein B7486_25965 [cyanobacterium TDX16]|nr:hypothetical protein B7486_25965 [cyanobacterium TDX16]
MGYSSKDRAKRPPNAVLGISKGVFAFRIVFFLNSGPPSRKCPSPFVEKLSELVLVQTTSLVTNDAGFQSIQRIPDD